MIQKVQKTTLLIVLLIIQNSIAYAQTPKNCLEILGLNPTSPSGLYIIDPDGTGPLPSMSCNCDMTTDGGGWTLVLNYNHLSGTNPALNVRTANLPLLGSTTLGTDESGTSFWGHADTTILKALDFSEVRFYGISSLHSRVINFKTAHLGTINYFSTGIGSTAGLVSSFTPLAGHSAFLPGAINSTTTNQLNYAMTEYPLWTASAYHWFLSPALNRWETDDYNFSLPSTIHQIWVRECTSFTTINQSACDSYTYNSTTYTTSGTYTHTFQSVASCDSIIILNLTVNNTPTATITAAGNTLTADITGANYQWVDCNNSNALIPGENSQIFTPSASGNYAGIITENGCADTSACENVIVTGVEDIMAAPFLISPNPSQGMFHLSINNANFSELRINIVDIQGKEIFNSFDRNVSAGYNKEINLERLSKGLYFIKLNTESDSITQKLIIQ